jgi:glutamate/tyrosine decarboxylase-like PLP-dependent enzyme
VSKRSGMSFDTGSTVHVSLERSAYVLGISLIASPIVQARDGMESESNHTISDWH